METRPPQAMMKPSQCAGCGSFIRDQYILRVSPDLEWHAACLRCVECGRTLDENCTCFVRNGKTYCKRDYGRLFGAQCAKCGDIFRKTDFVMRAKEKIYHMQCFRCVLCQKQLVTGDEFALTADGLCCKDDHKPQENNNNNNNSTKLASLSVNNSDSAKKMADFERKTESPLKMSGVLSPSGDSNESTATNGKRERKSSDSKTTRVRTVLNEKQLHTLRTCYNANPRPDALMKEQLVEMTGLSPRVIRVWFQNKRCKDKKREIYMKQLQEQGKGGRFGGLGQISAVPMVAGSPVRHGSPLPGQMVDVQSYQPPWKALTEFALGTDLEHMDPSNSAFQHLASQMHGYGVEGSTSCAFPGETDLRYSTPDDMLADFPEHQSDLSSHSD